MVEGIIQEDVISRDARYIFAIMVTQPNNKKSPDYEKMASECIKAAEAFNSMSILTGHAVMKAVK